MDRRSTQAPARNIHHNVTAEGARRLGIAAQFAAKDPNHKVDDGALNHEMMLARLDHTARRSPTVGGAWQLLVHGHLPPVPLDGAKPAGPPLESREDILAHFSEHPRHNVGLPTGAHPKRPWTYIGVAVDRFSNWTDWLHAAAKVTHVEPNYKGFASLPDVNPVPGEMIERHQMRDPGAYQRLYWMPPALPSFKVWWVDPSGGGIGGKRAEQKEGRGGWILLVVPDPNRNLKVSRDRNIAPGLTVLKSGTPVPWAATRDGWTLQQKITERSRGGLEPGPVPPAHWLVEALTA